MLDCIENISSVGCFYMRKIQICEPSECFPIGMLLSDGLGLKPQIFSVGKRLFTESRLNLAVKCGHFCRLVQFQDTAKMRSPKIPKAPESRTRRALFSKLHDPCHYSTNDYCTYSNHKIWGRTNFFVRLRCAECPFLVTECFTSIRH